MAMNPEFVALETRSAVRQAMKEWAIKFRSNGDAFPYRGADAYGHVEHGVWGFFNDPDGDGDVGAYWNGFGRFPFLGKKSLVVEINPPLVGINTNVQGVFARAANGSRWILHQGRLHPKEIRISEDMYDAVSKNKRVNVVSSDQNVVGYHRVANIDASPAVVQAQVSRFVAECDMVRRYYVLGDSFSKDVIRVMAAEGLFPETPGKYERGAQGQKTVVKRHANIWLALTDELTKRKIVHSNGRVARWGPDLLTKTSRPILFEIKSGGGASELQRAVGQLMLYENLLGSKHDKILVLPLADAPLGPEITRAVDALGISILSFVEKRGVIKFDGGALKSFLDRSQAT